MIDNFWLFLAEHMPKKFTFWCTVVYLSDFMISDIKNDCKKSELQPIGVLSKDDLKGDSKDG
jgi:hypothetical protein